MVAISLLFLSMPRRTKVHDLYDNVRRASKARMEQEFVQLIKENASYIIDLNTMQLLHGLGSDGNILGTYANIKYAELKEMMNPLASGAVDLKFTGKFHDSFYIRTYRFPITIYARDKKTGGLVVKYGDTIFGLTQKSLDDLADHLRPQWQERVRHIIDL